MGIAFHPLSRNPTHIPVSTATFFANCRFGIRRLPHTDPYKDISASDDRAEQGVEARKARLSARPARVIEESVAMRRISPRKRGSSVGFVPDPFRYRQVWFESGLEEAFTFVFIAHPDVREIREQQLVEFSENGRRVRRFVDLVVTWSNGSRVAYEIKYRQDVERSDIVQTLGRMCEQAGDALADDFRLLTEQDLHPATIANARAIVSAGADWDDEARETVQGCLRNAGPFIRLSTLSAEAGLGSAGYRAAISLLQEGCLVAPPGELLGPATILGNRLGRTAA